MRVFFYFAFFLVSFYFNAYKYDLMDKELYHIFPWSSNPQTAKTSLFWLRYHLVTALTLLLATFLHMCYPSDDRSQMFWIMVHYFFLFGVFPNVFHLGDASPWIAFLVNVGAGTALEIFIYNDWVQAYFWALCAPVVLEVVAYAGNSLRYH